MIRSLTVALALSGLAACSPESRTESSEALEAIGDDVRDGIETARAGVTKGVSEEVRQVSEGLEQTREGARRAGEVAGSEARETLEGHLREAADRLDLPDAGPAPEARSSPIR